MNIVLFFEIISQEISDLQVYNKNSVFRVSKKQHHAYERMEVKSYGGKQTDWTVSCDWNPSYN